MNNIPIIKIDKKFKKAMQERWSLRYAKRDAFRYVIKKTCPLCKVYFERHCTDCPFYTHGNCTNSHQILDPSTTCADFVMLFNPPRTLHMHVQEIKWDENDNIEVRIWIKQFKRKVKKYIRWI